MPRVRCIASPSDPGRRRRTALIVLSRRIAPVPVKPREIAEYLISCNAKNNNPCNSYMSGLWENAAGVIRRKPKPGRKYPHRCRAVGGTAFALAGMNT